MRALPLTMLLFLASHLSAVVPLETVKWARLPADPDRGVAMSNELSHDVPTDKSVHACDKHSPGAHRRHRSRRTRMSC